jgi:hypothetical protein
MPLLMFVFVFAMALGEDYNIFTVLGLAPGSVQAGLRAVSGSAFFRGACCLPHPPRQTGQSALGLEARPAEARDA